MRTVPIAAFPPGVAATVVTVGNFDGIHRGHERLVREVAARAGRIHASSAVVTFDPHTRAVVWPETSPRVLTTLEEKSVIIERLGIDYLVWIDFNERYAGMSAEEFIRTQLIARLKAGELIVGEGHTFGRDRWGAQKLLHSGVGGKHFSVFVSELVTSGGPAISSTEIRGKILKGQIGEALKQLGHPYLIAARHESGEGRGSGMGFPTLNFGIPPSPKVLPPEGVYAAELQIGERHLRGSLYIGTCPTLGARKAHLEFHSFDGVGEGLGSGDTGYLWVHRFVRHDATLEGKTELVAQIRKDVDTIQRFFAEEYVAWR